MTLNLKWSSRVRTLWLSLETTGLNTDYLNVLALSYWPEIEGEVCDKGPRHLKVQPVLHEEDQVWGQKSLESVVGHFNRRLSPESPERLALCDVKGKALFAFERSALTYMLEPPAKRDPLAWLLDKTRLSPKTALALLFEDLSALSSDGSHHQRWTLASYNGSFCLAAFVSWVTRVLGDEASGYLAAFNQFYMLDTLSLVRWAQYQRRFETHSATLKTVASALGVSYTLDPEAISLSELLAARDVARTLLSGDNYEHYQKPRVARREIPSKDIA